MLSVPEVTNSIKPRDCREGEAPCMVCGRPAKIETAPMAHAFCCVTGFNSNYIVVTDEEAAELHRTGQGGGDLGGQPIGRDCLRNHPELKPYVWQKPAKKVVT